MKVETIENGTEELIITGMIVSSKFFQEISRAAKPEYFNTDITKILVSWLTNYYFMNNHQSPGDEIRDIYELNKDDLDADESKTVRLFLKKISDEYSGREFNVEYVLPKALEYLERNAYEYRAKQVLKELKKENLSRAKEIFQSCSKEVFTETTQWKSLSDPELLNSWWDIKKEPLMSFAGELGKYMPKIERGRLYAMLGPPKRGKTYWLLEWAYNGAMEGLNVVFFSLEMSEQEIDSRWKEKLCGKQVMNETNKIYRIPVVDCLSNQNGECNRKECTSKSTKVFEGKILADFEKNKNHKPCTVCRSQEWFVPSHWFIEQKIGRLTNKEAIDRQKIFDKHFGPNRVRIKSFPISKATVSTLENALDELEFNTGVIPDMVVVDYADILEEDIKLGDKRHRVGDNWKQLSRMAKTRNIAVVTASQGNRNSSKKGRLSVDDVSEDFSKIMTIDAIFAINEDNFDKKESWMQDKNWQIQRIETLALRYGKFFSGLQCVTLNDLDRGQVCIDSYSQWGGK